MKSRRSAVDIAAMLRLISLTDYILAHTIRAAAQLGIADHLTGGPRTVPDLATAVGADPTALLRTLRALACNGIFTEVSEGCFGLTDLAEPLLTDHPSSVRGVLPLWPTELYTWADYHETMRTGAPAFPRVHGEPFFEFLAANPAERERFEAAQRGLGQLEVPAAVRGFPWQRVGSVVDIGGGELLAGLLAAQPQLRGWLAGLPAAADGAEQVLTTAGVADRAQLWAGDVTTGTLPEADVYLLKRTLCTFADDAAVALLRNIRAAMPAESRVLVFEPVRAPDRPAEPDLLVDLFLLMFTGGQVRTRDELAGLFAAAGLRPATTYTTPVFPIIEAAPR